MEFRPCMSCGAVLLWPCAKPIDVVEKPLQHNSRANSLLILNRNSTRVVLWCALCDVSRFCAPGAGPSTLPAAWTLMGPRFCNFRWPFFGAPFKVLLVVGPKIEAAWRYPFLCSWLNGLCRFGNPSMPKRLDKKSGKSTLPTSKQHMEWTL